jgi:hypothetical protein
MLYRQCLHSKDVDAPRPKTGTLPRSEFLRAMVSNMTSSSSQNLEVVCTTISGDKLNSRRPKDSYINWSMKFKNPCIPGLDLPPVMWSTTIRASFAQSKYFHHELGRKVKRDTPHHRHSTGILSFNNYNNNKTHSIRTWTPSFKLQLNSQLHCLCYPLEHYWGSMVHTQHLIIASAKKWAYCS